VEEREPDLPSMRSRAPEALFGSAKEESPIMIDAFVPSSEAATRRGLPPHTPTHKDELRLCFDWLPVITNGAITFIATIVRSEARSSVEFEVNLHRLDTEQLQQLYSVLSRRHAGLDNGTEVAGNVAWLLDLSLRQTSSLDLHTRQLAVRQMLLAS
jgi:hypothetical protein